ncbi:MAG: hypothetical protein PHU23_01070 [Dehalococcoidales bacterium]|nr:hypothetical protein [Dehalococcoidales bacterium]
MAEKKSDWVTPVAVVGGGVALTYGAWKVYHNWKAKPNEVSNIKITKYTCVETGESKSSGVLNILEGQNVEVEYSFEYQGVAANPLAHAAIWQKSWIDPHDEIVAREEYLEIPETSSRQTYTSSIIIPSQGIDPNNTYGLLVRLGNVAGGETIYLSGILHIEPAASEIISGVEVINISSTVQSGQNCTMTVRFNYQGVAKSLKIHAAIGRLKDTGGIEWFDEYKIKDVYVDVPTTQTPVEILVPNIAISTEGFSDTNSPYDIYAKVGSIASDYYIGALEIYGGSTAKLVLNFTPIEAAFTLDGDVYQSGSEIVLDPGTYSWTCARDGFEMQSGEISLTAGQTKTLTVDLVEETASLKIRNSPVEYGVVQVGLEGFRDEYPVNLYIQEHPTSSMIVNTGQGAYVPYGIANVDFYPNIPAGTYHLVADDNNGRSASIVLTIAAGDIIISNFWVTPYNGSSQGYVEWYIAWLDDQSNMKLSDDTSIYHYIKMENVRYRGSLAIGARKEEGGWYGPWWFEDIELTEGASYEYHFDTGQLIKR